MKKIIIIVFGIIICLIVIILGIRWAHLSNISEPSTIAMNYLKEEGLFILYHEGEYGPYTLTEDDLNDKPYSEYLSVQNQNEEFYIDKELHHQFFYVNKHPLSGLFGFGRIFVGVIMSDDEVVGAFSVKNGKTYSLLGEEE